MFFVLKMGKVGMLFAQIPNPWNIIEQRIAGILTLVLQSINSKYFFTDNQIQNLVSEKTRQWYNKVLQNKKQ